MYILYIKNWRTNTQEASNNLQGVKANSADGAGVGIKAFSMPF